MPLSGGARPVPVDRRLAMGTPDDHWLHLCPAAGGDLLHAFKKYMVSGLTSGPSRAEACASTWRQPPLRCATMPVEDNGAGDRPAPPNGERPLPRAGCALRCCHDVLRHGPRQLRAAASPVHRRDAQSGGPVTVSGASTASRPRTLIGWTTVLSKAPAGMSWCASPTTEVAMGRTVGGDPQNRACWATWSTAVAATPTSSCELGSRCSIPSSRRQTSSRAGYRTTSASR